MSKNNHLSESPLPTPPTVPGFPLLGSVLDISKDSRAFLTTQYLNYGPVFRVRALHRHFTVLAGAEANQFVMQEGKKYFRSKEFWQGQDRIFGAKRSMISVDGADHIRYRKVQRPGYSRSVILDRLPEAVSIISQEVHKWPLGQPLPTVHTLQRIITEFIGRLGTSYSPHAYLDDVIYFSRISLLTAVTRQLPAIFRYTPKYRRAKQRVWELGQKVLDVHQPEKRLGKSPDLVDAVLQLAREDPEFLPESDILTAVLGPFMAGLDTVANTCAFMLYLLLKHPSILAQATAEADRIFGQGELTPKGLKEFDIIHRTALETLRMYPIAPGVQRTVTQTFEFAGYTIREGEAILLAGVVPHYLPEFYPEPEKFDIDRYTPERNEHRRPGVFAPYGLGAHICLGAGFAEVQIVLMMALMLHLLELEMSPSDYELRIDPKPSASPDQHFKFQVVGHRQAV